MDGKVKFLWTKVLIQLLNIFWKIKMNLSRINVYFKNLFAINLSPGDYCERVIPDPIPNSEVKPFCANGTLS